MSALQEAPGARKGEPPAGTGPGDRDTRLSLRMLWWLPVSPFVGFALAGRVLVLRSGPPNSRG